MIRVSKKDCRNGSGDPDDSEVSFVVMGNRSLSWRGNLVLLASLAVTCLGIAGAMAYFGYWLVLPFAGLEVAFIALCLYHASRRASRLEVITIDNRRIKLEWGYNKPVDVVTLPRHWSQLCYAEPLNLFDVGQLSLQAFGKRYPLGTSLGREEKQSLYLQLQQTL